VTKSTDTQNPNLWLLGTMHLNWIKLTM